MLDILAVCCWGEHADGTQPHQQLRCFSCCCTGVYPVQHVTRGEKLQHMGDELAEGVIARDSHEVNNCSRWSFSLQKGT